MKFWKKTRGAISIFLIMILLPTMTLAGLFLDLSRVKMAEEVVATSADLALNTTLSQYDRNLKDFYGLLASCQNTADVIAVSKQYFVDSMVSAGFSTSAALEYYDNVADAFVGDEEIRDMLQLSVEGETTIEPSSNGAMNNPALLKTGIVEFMKYRAPVNGAASLFETLTNSEVSEEVQNASKEATMIEKKEAFYKAEKKLIKQAEKAYKAIKKYEKYKTWTSKEITNEAFLDDFSKFLASPDNSGDSFEQVYFSAHEKMVMNLYNTHDNTGTHKITLLKKSNITKPQPITTYSEKKKANAEQVKNLITDFNNKLKTYIQKKSQLDQGWNTVGKKLSTDYGIQYWEDLTNECKVDYQDYVSATKQLWSSALRLENAKENAEESALEEKISKPNNSYVTFDADPLGYVTLQNAYDVLIGKYNDSYKAEVTKGGCSSYKNINSQISAVDTTANDQLLKIDTVNIVYNTRNKVNKYATDFEEAAELADDAKVQTNKLKKLLKKYKEAFEDWDDAAYDSELNDSDLASENRTEIEKLRETGIELFSEDSVVKLTERLSNISTLWETFETDIKKIKYNGTKIVDISSYEKFYAAAGLDKSKIVRTQSKLKQYGENSFSFDIGKEIQRIIIKDNKTSKELGNGNEYIITDSFHPQVTKTRLELYEWMKKKFGVKVSGQTLSETEHGFSVTDEESAEAADESMSEKSDDTGDANTEGSEKAKDFKEWTGATLPSKDKNAPEEQSLTAEIGEVADFASDIFSNFSETFMASVKNTRDDIFMIDYVMNMFTYDTFNKEGYYSLLKEEEQKKVTPLNASGYYSSKKEDWKNSDEYKTLTLTPREKQYHWAYGGEVEYILYGNDTDAKNKTTAYSQIYLIRYAMDVSAVFGTYWSDEILNTVANALQAFAYIPAALTKTLACLAITAAEAGIDIAYLKQGIPVVLWKTKTDLICSYKSVFTGGTERTQKLNNKITLQYSDYIKIFLFLALLGNDENMIYVRTGDVIQANMTLVAEKDDYALSSAIVYYDFSSKVVMQPMWTRLLAIDNLGDLSSQKAWRTINITMTRGY